MESPCTQIGTFYLHFWVKDGLTNAVLVSMAHLTGKNVAILKFTRADKSAVKYNL